jgi:hypothetical protein
VSTLGRVSLVAYWLGLAAWFAAIVASGVAAVHAFGRLPDLEPVLPAFKALDDIPHDRLAAGYVMEGVFQTVDATQVAAAILVVLASIGLHVGRLAQGARWSNALRFACLGLAMVILAAALLGPVRTLRREQAAFWSAARAGDVDRAREHRAMFVATHGLASAMYRVNLLLLTAGIASSALALGPRAEPPSTAQDDLQ